MKKMLRGLALLAGALAIIQAPARRAEAAHVGAARFSSLIHSHAVHANALTARQEIRLKSRIVFQQFLALRLAARIDAIQHIRTLLSELRQGLITRAEFFTDRQSVSQSFRSSSLILRARLTATLTAIRNDPFGTPATLVR